MIIIKIKHKYLKFNSKIFNFASFCAYDKIKMNGEIAYESNDKTNGLAYSLEAYLNLKKWDFINSAQYSDKNYKGYLRSSKQLFCTTASGTIKPRMPS